MSESVAKRYAEALFEVAKDHGEIDGIKHDLSVVTEAFQDKKFQSIFLNPNIGVQRKKELIDQVTQPVNGKVTNLLKLIIDHHREDQLENITETYITIANKAEDMADVVVTTAFPLSEKDKNQLAEAFGKALNKKLRMNAKVDRNLIGGALIRIGNRVYDGSISGKLSRFKQRLAQVQVR